MELGKDHIILQNNNAALQVDLQGGAITQFYLKEEPLNPLDFCLEQPGPGGDPFYFKGHFLCLGRWGDPSEAEQAAGMVKHGDFTRLPWTATAMPNGYQMEASSTIEGLSIQRRIRMDETAPVFHVEETVQNLHPVSRLFNMVQHPSIAAPFLNAQTVVDCNASVGFDYAFDQYQEDIFSRWPMAITKAGNTLNLRNPETAYSSVFSYIVESEASWGWLTAYSPVHHLLLGYIWPRSAYPWINLWTHANGSTLAYRGLEFGTTGIHKPFTEILHRELTHVLGEKTIRYLGPAQTERRRYTGFLQKCAPGFMGVDNILYDDKRLTLITPTGEINIAIWNTDTKQC